MKANELTPKLTTKLIVHVSTPPVILFRIDGSGVHKRVDVTNIYEHANGPGADQVFWLLPAGRYVVSQLDCMRSCVVKDGVVSWLGNKKDDSKRKIRT